MTAGATWPRSSAAGATARRGWCAGWPSRLRRRRRCRAWRRARTPRRGRRARWPGRRSWARSRSSARRRPSPCASSRRRLRRSQASSSSGLRALASESIGCRWRHCANAPAAVRRPAGWASRALRSPGNSVFELLQLAQQQVVVGVADLGPVEHVVEVGVALDLATQLGGAAARLVGHGGAHDALPGAAPGEGITAVGELTASSRRSAPSRQRSARAAGVAT